MVVAQQVDGVKRVDAEGWKGPGESEWERENLMPYDKGKRESRANNEIRREGRDGDGRCIMGSRKVRGGQEGSRKEEGKGKRRRTYRADMAAVKIYCTITPNYICPLNYRIT